jgi:AAA domain-containing protein
MAKWNKPRPKHQVLKARGKYGLSQLLRQIGVIIGDKTDPARVVFLGDCGTIEGLANRCFQKLKKTYGEESAKNIETTPHSLRAKVGALNLARLVNVASGDRRFEDPILPDIRMAVVFDDGVRYLDALLDRCDEPLTIVVAEEGGGDDGGLTPLEGWEHLGGSVQEPFLAMCDTEEEPVLEPIVEDVFLRKGIHCWAGLFESYKTMAGIELCAAILQGREFGGRFKLTSDREFLAGVEVLWLNLDMPHWLFRQYAAPFGLDKEPRFRWNSPTAEIALGDPRLAEEARGKILVVDTMLDLARIKDAFQSSEWVDFFAKLRSLIRNGCEGILLIAHPTKASQRSNEIDPAAYLKDSVTFGGKLDVGFAFRCVPDTGQVHVERIKGRGFKKKGFKFGLAVTDEDGNSNLDKGEFPVCSDPEDGESFASKAGKKKKGGAQPDPKKFEKLDWLKKNFKPDATGVEMAEALNKEFNSDHAPRTVKGWRQEAEGLIW